jgi:hypothetical protein
LNEHSNIPHLAQQIVEKCKLIHQSKLPLIESLLHQLKDKKIQDDRSTILPTKERRPDQNGSAKNSPAVAEDAITPERIEQYIEKLYESPEERLAATDKILHLARNQDNLEALLADGMLLTFITSLINFH